MSPIDMEPDSSHIDRLENWADLEDVIWQMIENANLDPKSEFLSRRLIILIQPSVKDVSAIFDFVKKLEPHHPLFPLFEWYPRERDEFYKEVRHKFIVSQMHNLLNEMNTHNKSRYSIKNSLKTLKRSSEYIMKMWLHLLKLAKENMNNEGVMKFVKAANSHRVLGYMSLEEISQMETWEDLDLFIREKYRDWLEEQSDLIKEIFDL